MLPTSARFASVFSVLKLTARYALVSNYSSPSVPVGSLELAGASARTSPLPGT